MATNDPYSIMMGLGTMGDDHDDDLRKRRLDEEYKIRAEDRAEQRGIAKEWRDEDREQRRLDHVNNLNFDFQKRVSKYNDQIATKTEAAQLGIPFKGVDPFTLKAQIANFKANQQPADLLILDKKYIDRLDKDAMQTEDDALFASQIKSMSPEDLQSLPRNEALAIVTRIKPFIDKEKAKDAEVLVRNNPNYKAFVDRYNKGEANMMGYVQKLLVPSLLQQGTKGADVSHAAAYAVLKENPEFNEILNKKQQQAFMLNPTQFLGQYGDPNNDGGMYGVGARNMEKGDHSKLFMMWVNARIQAKGLLEGDNLEFNIADSSGKLRAAQGEDKSAAIKFLKEENAQKDFNNAREQFLRFAPELMRQQSDLLKSIPDSYKPYIFRDIVTQAQEMQNATPQGTTQGTPATPPTSKRPSLPGQRPAALGVDQSTAPTSPAPKPRATAPLPSDVNITGEAGKLMNAPQGQKSPVEIAEDVLGNQGFFNSLATEGIGSLVQTQDPLSKIQQAIRFLEQQQRAVSNQLSNRGASRSGKSISISDSTNPDLAPYLNFGQPQLKKSAEQLRSDQIEIPQLFKQYDDIGIQLSTLRKAIEGQAGQKLPLGAGAKQ
jgi:hypothetical protein|tara:strand:+ start:2559 stop:4367 length:1809 start_codon:yes stop_codon:yes gene_type:complete